MAQIAISKRYAVTENRGSAGSERDNVFDASSQFEQQFGSLVAILTDDRQLVRSGRLPDTAELRSHFLSFVYSRIGISTGNTENAQACKTLLIPFGKEPEVLVSELQSLLQQVEEGLEADWVPQSGNPVGRLVEDLLNRLKWAFFRNFYRTLMNGWENGLRPGTIRVVRATMGIGKTRQYAKALLNNGMSAMIFLPTRHLIHELQGRDFFNSSGNAHVVIGVDPDESIEDQKCIHVDAIMRVRQNGLMVPRKQFCKDCDIRRRCHTLEAEHQIPQHRIVLTTHAQYLKYVRDPESAYYQPTPDAKAQPRDLWIIDENLVPNYLHKVSDPAITLGQIQDVIKELRHLNIHASPVEEFWDRVSDVWEDAALPPIDPAFDLTPEQLAAYVSRNRDWKQREKRGHMNYLREVIAGIQRGCTAERYKGDLRIRMPMITPVKNIKDLPPHVFFDGTPPDETIFQRVYPQADVEHFPRDLPEGILPVPGSLKIIHTPSTHLARFGIRFRCKSMVSYLSSVVQRERQIQAGKPLRVLIIATKEHLNVLRDELGDEWEGLKIHSLSRPLPTTGNYLLLAHFGALRGRNNAEKCNVGIMLGSFLESDTVAVTRALPDLADLLPPEGCSIRTLINRYDMGEQDIAINEAGAPIVQHIEEQQRLQEHLQALARTRHLNQMVRFYIVSKDEFQNCPLIRPEDYKVDDEGLRIFKAGPAGRPPQASGSRSLCEKYLQDHPEGFHGRHFRQTIREQVAAAGGTPPSNSSFDRLLREKVGKAKWRKIGQHYLPVEP